MLSVRALYFAYVSLEAEQGPGMAKCLAHRLRTQEWDPKMQTGDKIQKRKDLFTKFTKDQSYPDC